MLAAGLGLVTAYFAYSEAVSHAEASLAHKQHALAEIEAQAARNQLEAERIIYQHIAGSGGGLNDAKIVLLAPAAGSPATTAGTRGAVIWNAAQQTGVAQVAGLGALAHGEEYQVWILPGGGGEPIAAGALSVDAQGNGRLVFKPQSTVATVAGFGIAKARTGAATATPPPPREYVLRGP